MNYFEGRLSSSDQFQFEVLHSLPLSILFFVCLLYICFQNLIFKIISKKYSKHENDFFLGTQAEKYDLGLENFKYKAKSN